MLINLILLKQVRIIKLTLFIFIILGPLYCQAYEKKKISYDYYEIICNDEDSVLAQKLLKQIQRPLKRIENFFDHKPGSMITIYLTTSEREYKKYSLGKTPDWSQAVAYIQKRLIVLKLSSAEEIKKSPQILLHELTHIFISDRLPPERIPVWLNEGLADYLSGDELSLDDKVVIANALAAKKIISLADFDSLIYFEQPQAKLAYVQALSTVQYFVRMHGVAKLRELIQNLGNYRSINDAFEATVGYDFIDFEINWYQDLYKRYRWLVILNLDNIIWIIICLLAISAIIAVKFRNRKKLRDWEVNEPDM